ncbi:glycosyltransferase family 9 protein [Vibrio sp.]|uniref:glycosyltransferase family 9 protein n=1 Tax=Vibrio sp. TaxID=678 RepID=UPI003D0B93A0
MRFIISKLQLYRDIVRRELGLIIFDRKKPLDQPIESTRSILFIRNDAKLGDAIVSSAVIKKIRKHRPDIKIQVLTTSGMASIFEQHFKVDQVIAMNKRPSYSEIRRVCQQVGEVDLVWTLNPHMKMKDIYFLKHIRSKFNVGIDTKVKLLNVNIQQQTQGQHFAKKFDYLSVLLGIDAPQERYMVPLIPTSLTKLETYISDNSIGSYILFNPFGSGSERKLNKSNITQILQVLQRQFPQFSVVMLSSPETHQLLDNMQLTGDKVLHFSDSESIYDAIAAVHFAKLVVSVDTSIVHIATGLDKPQLALYRSDKVNFAHWNPNSEKAVTVNTGKAMNDLDIGQLEEKAQSLQKLTAAQA